LARLFHRLPTRKLRNFATELLPRSAQQHLQHPSAVPTSSP
jgi:hypothetical protein